MQTTKLFLLFVLLTGIVVPLYSQDRITIRHALGIYHKRTRDLNSLISHLIFRIRDENTKMEELQILAETIERLEKQHLRLYQTLGNDLNLIIPGKSFCTDVQKKQRGVSKLWEPK